MSWVATAVTAGVTLLGSSTAAKSQNKAINSAAASEKAASDAQIALQREQLDRAEALNRPFIEQGSKAQAYMDALNFGEGTYGGPAPTPAGGSSYSSLYAGRTDPSTMVESDELRRAMAYGRSDPRTVADAPSVADGASRVTRADAESAISESAPYRYGEQEFYQQQNIADGTYVGESSRIDDAYGAETSDADRAYGLSRDVASQAKAGRVGLAKSNLDSRLKLEDDSYAAWEPLSQKAERDAIDSAYSRLGVTGQTGRTARTVGETTQDAAMERNLRKLQGYQTAYSPYYEDTTRAEDTYWGDYGAATDAYNTRYADATNVRGQRNLDAYGRQRNTYATNQANRTANRQNAYADYMNTLKGTSDRGYSASGASAGYGQNYTAGASNAIGRSADAASDAAYARGAVQQTLYGDLARTAGDAYGAIRNRTQQKKATYA